MKITLLTAAITLTISMGAMAQDSEQTMSKIKATPAGLSAATLTILDSDRDGISNEADQCLATPFGAPVDEQGCSLCPDGTVDATDGCFIENGETLVYPINVKFDTASSIVDARYLNELFTTSQLLLDHKVEQVVVSGHTDAQGSEEYNEQLAQERALAVAAVLTRYGVPATAIKAEGHGELKPIADNESEQGRLQNRRVTAEVRVDVEDKKYVVKK